MKLEILKENLQMGVSMVEWVAGKGASLPILEDVVMGTEDSFLKLISTNLETSITVWVLTKILEKGVVVVPVKFISGYVSSLPKEKIILESKDQNLHLECGNVKTKIQGHNPEDFPIIPEFSNLEYVEVENAVLCQALSQVVDIAIPTQSRPEISGIYFSFSGATITMAATDSFRLAEKKVPLKEAAKKEHAFILPQRPAREILNILDGKEGVLKMYFSGNQVLFEFPMKEAKHPQIQVMSRLIEGEYPTYQDIIPTKFKAGAVVARESFFNQVKTASLFSNKTNEVKISINPSKSEVGIFAQNPEVGQNQSALPAKTIGEAMEISFNYRYVLDGLSKIRSSEVSFEVSKEDGPCILKPVGDASYLYVLMPIKSI